MKGVCSEIEAYNCIIREGCVSYERRKGYEMRVCYGSR